MNYTNYTELIDLVSANDARSRDLIPAMVVLGLFMIVGTVGNSIVCYVFGCRMKSGTQNFLIVGLAVFDLLSCLISMPAEITDMRYSYNFPNVGTCKAVRFMNSFTSIGSIITLLVIAIDRYRKICHPFKSQMDSTHVKLALIPILGGAMFFAAPSIALYGLRTIDLGFPKVKGRDCSIADDVKDSVFPLIYQGILLFCFIFLCVTLIVLYSCIFCSATRHNKYMKRNSSAGCTQYISSDEVSDYRFLNSEITSNVNCNDKVEGINANKRTSGLQNGKHRATTWYVPNSSFSEKDSKPGYQENGRPRAATFSFLNSSYNELDSKPSGQENGRQRAATFSFLNSCYNKMDSKPGCQENGKQALKAVETPESQALEMKCPKSLVKTNVSCCRHDIQLDQGDTPDCTLESSDHDKVLNGRPHNCSTSPRAGRCTGYDNVGYEEEFEIPEVQRNRRFTIDETKQSESALEPSTLQSSNRSSDCVSLGPGEIVFTAGNLQNQCVTDSDLKVKDDVLVLNHPVPHSSEIDIVKETSFNSPNVEVHSANDISEAIVSTPINCYSLSTTDQVCREPALSQSTPKTSTADGAMQKQKPDPIHVPSQSDLLVQNISSDCDNISDGPNQISCPCTVRPISKGNSEKIDIDILTSDNIGMSSKAEVNNNLSICVPPQSEKKLKRISFDCDISAAPIEVACQCSVHGNSVEAADDVKTFRNNRSSITEPNADGPPIPCTLKSPDTTLNCRHCKVDDVENSTCVLRYARSVSRSESVSVKKRNLHNLSSRIKTKTTTIAFMVTIVFILSFLPHLSLQLSKIIITGYDYRLEGASLVLFNICLRSYFINSISNPIIYGVLNVKFRAETRRLFHRLTRYCRVTTTK